MNETVVVRSRYDVFDDVTLHLFDTVINCILLNTIAVFGVAGNLLNVIILSIHGFRDSTNVILMSLSLVDLVYDVMLPLRRIRCVVSKFDDVIAQNIDNLMNVYLVVPMRLVSFISSGHIVLISIERTVAVYFPLKVNRIFTVPRTLLVLAFIYTFWIIMCGPYYGMFSFVWGLDAVTNRSVSVLAFSDYFIHNFDIFNVINVFIIAIIRIPFSILVIATASIATGIKLREMNRRRRKMSSLKEKTGYDVKAVKMLLVVTVVYLAFAIPSAIPSCMYYIDLSFVVFQGKTTSIYTAMEFLVDLLYIVNSSVNFLIYVTMSTKFSRTYRMLMGRTNARKRKSRKK